MRVVALTGTPGTGKTAIAQQVDRAEVVEANDLARRVGALEGRDEEREADIVDEQRLADEASQALPEGPVLVEGHLAHHCPADLVVLLRCHPDELRRRLATRDWPEAKIEENVMAETLDALAAEIDQRPAREVDTTDADPGELAERLDELFDDGSADADWLSPLGTVDWTDTLAEGSP